MYACDTCDIVYAAEERVSKILVFSRQGKYNKNSIIYSIKNVVRHNSFIVFSMYHLSV